jgi:glycosyltransferase involved in cell wall biosynthesis
VKIGRDPREESMEKLVSVVVPVYNEEESITALIKSLSEVRKELGRDMEIILVDDGSRDNSFDVMKRCKEGSPGEQIKIIRFKKNFGQTAAIAAGVDNARGDIVVTIDADLQNDPADIPELIAGIDEGYDVVSGWRKNRKDNFLSRKLPSMLANRLISFCIGSRLNDYGCTLKAYKKTAFDEIDLYGELHRFIPALMKWGGARIKEVPVRHHARKFGKSKYGIFRTVNVVLDLLTVRFLLSSSKGPMQIFGRLGFLCSLIGFVAGIATILMRIFGVMNMTGNPLLYFSILMFVVGTQFMSLGLLGELSMRTYHKSHKRKIYVVESVA